MVVTIVLLDGGFRCGRGGVASSACFACGFSAFVIGPGVVCAGCFGCDFAAFGVGAGEVAWSACFVCGLLTGCVGSAGADSADEAETGGGIVMAGFFASGDCFC